MLLWCAEIIDTHRFDKSVNALYPDSDLREWLNGEFLNKAFTPEEQKILIDTEIAEGESDKVFILSEGDFEKYNIKTYSDARPPLSLYVWGARGRYNQYAIDTKDGKYTSNYKNCTMAYWVRTSQERGAVLSEGKFLNCDLNNEKPGVLPALWISTN